MQAFPSKRSLLKHAVQAALLGACLGGGVLPLAVMADSASADTQVRAWAIAPGSLTSALDQFARQAGISLSYDATSVAGKTSTGLSGNFDREQALGQLLRGQGLQAQRQGKDIWLLLPQMADTGALNLSATTVTGQRLGALTEGTGSYTTGAVTIGKGQHSLRETPQSVSVMTRQLMDDQNVTTIDDVMERTPGITTYESPMGGKYFYSRGFKMLGQYQYDGVPLDMGKDYVQADSFSANMAIYDRVEVLKGAAGMLKGAGTASGAVNFVRKRPQATPTSSLMLSAGTWDNYRADVDTGGPLNDSGTVRGRAAFSQQDRGSYMDISKRQDQAFYTALDVDLSPDTTLGVGASYEDVDASPCWGGLPRYSDGKSARLSRSTCLGQSWNDWQSRRTTFFADLTHHFNDDWQIKVAAVHSRNLQDTKYAASEGTIAYGAPTPTANSYAALMDYEHKDFGLDAYIDGKFQAFGLEHELILGANGSRGTQDDVFAIQNLPTRQSIYQPDHHFPEPANDTFWPNMYRGGTVKETATQYGTYATLRLRLAEPLMFIVGSRVSWYENRRQSNTLGWGEWSVQDARTKESGEVTPFAALIYDLDEHLSLYASYADIFQPQSSYATADGAALKPKMGDNYELGIKGEWFDGRLNSSIALFRATEKNGAETDFLSFCPTSSDGYCYTDTAKVRAQGVEAEVSGQLLERLQVSGGYTYTQTKSLKNIDTAIEGGASNTYVPRHMLRMWGDYQLDGALSKWSVGTGVNAQSGNYRMQQGLKLEQAGYTVWDARLAYRVDDTWTVALNAKNLFDKNYYQTVGTASWGNFYGEPRNFTVSLKGTF
ncbi:TonB-dependent siderophore receptor [Pseudomonas sp. PA-7-1E]|uniref:TonB-dependent siderophore receptor n=2 Tax=Pseudomonas TaxID=286 RepID=A0A4Q0HQR5_PSEAZ|nr:MULTISPECIES: TonB-dependent receptor [Pseudomonas]KRP91452.1 TonB-dependent receptor [Pseudomonas lactis]KWV79355.1 Ferripyoverdine receptor precursor [Pseudomonas fluorescens]MBA1255779.1 TonB-dependent siderophore receptor [Pseudomonas carnis]MBA1270737.1 TonB-dependent siderophore receptor [Pseudomonas carnis]MBH3465573.1 TonB-dependent siderophore receptor [Pseudomonas carnis]